MNEADEAELHRLCAELERIDRQQLSASQREALKKAALALSAAFIHDLRADVERKYNQLGQPPTDDERQRMKSVGLNPDVTPSTFNIDFSDEGIGKLSRSVGLRMKTQLAEKLAAAGLADRVRLTFSENDHGVPVDFHLEGSAEDVAKAKEALRLDEKEGR